MSKKSVADKFIGPSLELLLDSGAHFGHLRSRRHPRMRPFIFTVRNKVSVINLEETVKQISAAAAFLCQVVASGQQILFVGSKRQAKPAITAVAEKLGMPSVSERWLGGTLTNSGVILRNIETLKKLEQQLTEQTDKTKKEQLDAARSVAKLQRRLGGLLSLESEVKGVARERQLSVGALVIVDVRREKTAVAEAKSSGVPIVALIDTDADPRLVTFPIVMNDDAAAAIAVVLESLGDAIERALQTVNSQKVNSSE